ncbi:aminotransferase class I/II-fold pyridoxal phosphate-dependent enzyme [Peribacillus alkalitolerans]|uniref:aminotransferase class I/II-fold pyridoxal phosphate-dependent enzyme n=1 Tax=Peribacillus alkalitolerans TaxID=1550385 RepID=UPI0013D22030|nr:aminotransferase class I/II-fold pyridoxal phosphate-dependent enzyme [Peribacillus alkalitolerans]
MKLQQIRLPLFEVLERHRKSGALSFHVPGHKNGLILSNEMPEAIKGLLAYDMTELPGLDDLHHPEEAILEAQLLLSDFYQSKKSYFLVNGSTVGNLAMILGVCQEGDVVLVQRNCHKSILHGLMLAKVEPVFLQPELNDEWKMAGGITVEGLQEAILSFPDAKALIITSPDYYGKIHMLEPIINLAHKYHIPVLVDEAHGAHFVLGSPFPASAAQFGADIVVHSAHKTLPAMTMGSYLHIYNDRVDEQKVEMYLQMLQSSSPSYPIMMSLDHARHYLANFVEEDIVYTLDEMERFKQDLRLLSGVKVLEGPKVDPLKVTLQVLDGYSGFQLLDALQEAGVFAELADPYNVLFILPLLKKGQPFPYQSALRRISSAIEQIKRKFQPARKDIPFYQPSHHYSKLEYSFKEMGMKKKVLVSILESANRVCAEMIIPYPPGIPLIMNGEIMTHQTLSYLTELIDLGTRFHGGSLLREGKVWVYE